MPSTARILPFLILPLAAACGEGAGSTPSSLARVDTVGGVERILYPEAGAPRLAWGADTLAVIGDALAEESAYQFDQVAPSGLAGGGAGTFFVLDRLGKRVLEFDSAGRHLGTHGSPGGGPGELEQPFGLALGPGDSLWVVDVGNQRVTVYPREGGEARSIPFDLERGLPDQNLRVDARGVLQAYRPLAFAGPTPGAEERGPSLLRLSHDLEPLDTLFRAAPPRRNVVRTGDGDNVAVMVAPTAFAPDFEWAAFPDGGVVASDSAEYVLTFIDAEGNVTRIVQRDPPARATTEADREAERERRRNLSGRGGVRIAIGGPGPGGGGPEPNLEAMLERQLASLTFEPVIPRIVDLRVDAEGRLWVGVSTDTPTEVGRIDVYDRDGALLGELTGFPMPDAFLGDGLALDLDRDELDVQTITVMRITGS